MSANINPLETVKKSKNARNRANKAMRKSGNIVVVQGPQRGPSAAQIIRDSHEPKNLDYSNSGALSTTTGQLTLLNACVQGTGGVNRTGRETRMEHLRLNMMFSLNQSTAADAFRYIIFTDDESNGAAPTVGTVLTNTTFGLPAILSSHNFDNCPPQKKPRFRILADEVLLSQTPVSGNAANTIWYAPFVHRIVNLPLKKRVQYYNASNAGTIADIVSGALYLLVWGESLNAATFTVDSRVIFRDL